MTSSTRSHQHMTHPPFKVEINVEIAEEDLWRWCRRTLLQRLHPLAELYELSALLASVKRQMRDKHVHTTNARCVDCDPQTSSDIGVRTLREVGVN